MTDKQITAAIKKNMDKIVKICKENGIDYMTLSYRNCDEYEGVMFNNNYYEDDVKREIEYADIKEK
jgi:ketol-acid reductoisomerase